MVLGSLIEEATAESARKAIRALVKINPENATVIYDGEEKLFLNLMKLKKEEYEILQFMQLFLNKKFQKTMILAYIKFLRELILVVGF